MLDGLRFCKDAYPFSLGFARFHWFHVYAVSPALLALTLTLNPTP